jgi:RNA polymerase sigma-70 factor (ECF subfamily)
VHENVRQANVFVHRRRRIASRDDDLPVSEAAAASDQGPALLALYDSALPEVYGYLVRRCDGPTVAEDLTAETFLAAVTAVQKGTVPQLTTAWLIGVARHKLVDHWRRQARDERNLRAVADEPAPEDDPWDAQLDAAVAHEVLGRLGAHHRSALMLRYLDGLSVPEVAEHLGRTVHATEALLVRARLAFRRAYEGSDDG